MDIPPINFYDEAIEVTFDHPPALEKSPPCPAGFTWRNEFLTITEMLAEWHDYNRRGKMERNMTPVHASTARIRGSWGVGRFYFRVLTGGGRVFDLYYDRAPGNASDRKGGWYIYCERRRE